MNSLARTSTFAPVWAVVILLLAGCGQSLAADTWQTRFDWKDAGIGPPAPAGSHTWANAALKLTGGGAGLNGKDGDQCQFVHVTRKAGDFEVSARLAEFTGEGDATAGILVRSGDKPTAAMAAVYSRAKDNTVNYMSRVPADEAKAPASVFANGIGLANKGPLWLRMVRIGNNFAVYKSRDGKLWSMISNVSGGPIAIDGPVQVGFFCTSAAAGKTASATFDSIKIGPPHMRYKTSWVGNSFGCRPEDGHVSNTLSAMWVAADGTCYTSSYWDEAGEPVKSYRDGKVLRGLPIGTPQTGEGGITGDGKHLYVATVSRITELDPAAKDFAPRPITLSVNLMDKKKDSSVVSGMASNGRELFVADSRDNLIRVVTLEPVKTYQVAEAANNRVVLAPEPVALPVPEKDAQFGPKAMYQTQRSGEGVRYTFPGLQAGAVYTLRLHLAEYVKRPDNADPRNRVVGIDGKQINVAELAGGVLKAAVQDLPGYMADAKGNVTMHFGSYGGPGICGIEVLDAQGHRVLAVNCGGPAVGDFKGESEELVERGFAFERPGVMTFDKRGDLWIIQHAMEGKAKASVKCYQTDGKFTGREIADVTNPNALGYDAAKDQLLAGEGLPDLNVRFYGSLDGKPALVKTFGEKGGIYAGKRPGLVNDPAAGGLARFGKIAGLGVDAKGNLYVGGGWQGSDLRMFTPDGKFGWMLYSLMFCGTYDVDPASDGADIYGTYSHVKLDLSKTKPGTEQKYVGYNWDLRRFGEPARPHSSQSIVRRLGADKRLMMYTSGQGNVGDINIFRYEGELAIPCGGTRNQGSLLWVDTNGDGKESADELTKMAPAISGLSTICVDSKGDLWAGCPTTAGSFMRHFPLKGFSEKGVPLYSGAKGGYEDIRFPEEGDKTNAWGMACRMDYDADRDIMIAFFPGVARKGEGDKSPAQYFMARYDNWSKGNRTSKWKVKAFTPNTDPDYFMYETNLYPYAGYMGMQMVGDYVFKAYLFGEIHVFDAATGQIVEIMSMGPEVAGRNAWEDAAMGLRAFKCKNGEYLIFTENSGWGGKNHFLRWKPQAAGI